MEVNAVLKVSGFQLLISLRGYLHGINLFGPGMGISMQF
jgi:hypothetical protein